MNEKLENYIIGIMGRKGSGKTFFVKKALVNIKRYIIIDPLDEYEKGMVFDNVYELDDYINFFGINKTIKIIFRPQNEESMEKFFEIIKKVNNYTLITEEVDNWCDSHNIHPVLSNMIKYGRHKNKNLIWVSRCPFEINRLLTRNCDMIVTFVQTEPRDLEFLEKLSFNKNIAKLGEYEYSYWVQNPKEAEKLLSLFNEKPQVIEKEEIKND